MNKAYENGLVNPYAIRKFWGKSLEEKKVEGYKVVDRFSKPKAEKNADQSKAEKSTK